MSSTAMPSNTSQGHGPEELNLQYDLQASNTDVDNGVGKATGSGGNTTNNNNNASSANVPQPGEQDMPKVGALELLQFADTQDRVMMIGGALAAFASGAGRPAFSFIMGKMISKLAERGDIEAAMAQYALIMVYLGSGIFVCSLIFVTCYQVAASRQVNRIQRLYFGAVLHQDIAWHDEHKPGELTARMLGDTKVILNGINDKFGLVFRCLGMFIGGFAFGFAQSWELTLVMVGCLPLLAAGGALMSTQLKQLTEKTRAFFAKAGETAMEAMENIKTAQVFGAEEFELSRFEESLSAARDAGIRKEFVGNVTVGATYFIMYSCYTILFFFSSYLLEWGRIEVGEVLGVFFAVLMGSFGIGLMVPSLTAYTEARAAAYHVFATILRTPRIDITAGGHQLPGGLSQNITLSGIHFAYPTRKDQPLFKGFNLCIEKGTTVAFTGASGCGKSSIVGLLQRFYDPDQGSVLVDGHDLRSLDAKWWRDQVGIVAQEPTLFSGTIADNVRVGSPNATLDEVVEACRQANIHDTILSLPQQYDTPVGSVGSQLSGGQKQRIAIARAIIKKPRLLLLDEATSALDRQSEVEVQAALEDVMRAGELGEKLTVVVVAHRLATIRNVDKIHYLVNHGVDEGCIVAESGTFDELMALDGAFAAMARRQAFATEAGTSPTSAASPRPNQDSLSPASPGKQAQPAGQQRKAAKQQSGNPGEEQETNVLKGISEKEFEEKEVPASRVMLLNWENAWAVVVAILGSAITGSVYPAYSIVLGEIMSVFADAHVRYGYLREKTPLFASMFIVIGAGSLCGWLLQAFYAVAGERLTLKLRSLLFRAILRQDQTFFDTPGRDPGSLSAVLSGDCEIVHQLWGPSIGAKVQMGCAVVGGLVIAFIFSWKLALVALSTLPALALGSMIQRMMTITQTSKSFKDKKEDTITAEAFTNIQAVAAFNLQPKCVSLYADYVEEAQQVAVTNAWAAGFAFGFSQFIMFGVAALIYWYGGRLISRGEATFQDVVTCSMAIMMAGVGAGEAGGFAAKLTDSYNASKRVFAVIDRVPEIDPQRAGGVVDFGPGVSIVFDEVAFAYPARPSVVVLSNFSTSVANGHQVGLIGQTGSGKSTIIQLLARFYNPLSGSISINDKSVELSGIDLRTWRSRISIVLQEPSLFSGTVEENIRYSRPNATFEDVVHAAKLAAIHDDIMAMPNGYHTQVGYRGRALSGGQKQRVAIARGILRKPDLLLLDEATSALDNATEARVQEGLLQAYREHPMTILAVAHRLTTIQHSDNILLLDKGVVREEGNHTMLMANEGGEYRKRFELFFSTTVGLGSGRNS